MFRRMMLTVPLLLICAAAAAGDAQAPADAKPAADAKVPADAKGPTDVKMSGMSVLGNEEAPKSLVIVPWKSSQLGDAPGLSRLLDDAALPVDKEVFLRELGYYQIRSTSN